MIYILDREGKTILDTMDTQGENIYWDDRYYRTIFNTEKFDFKALPESRASQFLGDRNRVVIQTEDGFFREFIIIQTTRDRNAVEVVSVGAQLELAEDEPFPKLKREGDTINTIIDYALSGSRWDRGETEFTMTRDFDTDGFKTPLQVINRAGALFDVEISFRIDIDPGGNRIKGRYVDAKVKNPPNRGKKLVYGKDLLNVTNTDDNSEIYTALIGVAPRNEEGEELYVQVKNEIAREIWGIEGKHRWGVYEPQSDEEDMTEGQIQYYTEQELEKRIASVVEYEVDAVDLEHVFGYEHEKIRLGDEVRIVADDINPGLYLKARIINAEYPISDPSKKKFTLGEFIEVPEQDILAELRQIQRKVAIKANKTLIDSTGEESGLLNGEGDNFGSLYVGDLSSPTVPMKSQTDLLFYVSDRVISGGDEPSDDNDGQSFDSPLRTVAEAVRRIPEQLYHEARIVLAYAGDYYEYIRLDGFVGSGKIVINGQYKWGTTLHNGLRFSGCQVDVEVREMLIISESTYEVFATNAGKTHFIDCTFKGKQGGTEVAEHGLIAYDNGTVRAEGCHFYDIKHAMFAYDGGHIVNIDNKGNATRNGLRVVRGGRITGGGTAPSGDIANVYSADGGIVNSADFTFDASTDQSDPTTGTTTEEWSSTDSDSYQPNSWDSTTDDVLQGQWGSAGPYWGAWFFGSAPSTAVTGKTIKQIRIYVTRANNSGSGSGVPIHFRMHSYTSEPSGSPGFSGTPHTVTFRRGEGKWVTLPSSFHAEFESGSRKGIGIYSGTSNYARMLQSAKLEITYEG